MMKTHTVKLIAFNKLLKNKDFLTPATNTSIISNVIPKAMKSGGFPVNKIKNLILS